MTTMADIVDILDSKSLLTLSGRALFSDVEITHNTAKAVSLDNEDDLMFVFPSLDTGTWFRVVTVGRAYPLSSGYYTKILYFKNGVNRIVLFDREEVVTRKPRVPPL